MKPPVVPPRLAVVATHPIQYYAPLFRRLAARGAVRLRVFYEWEGPAETIDHDFGRAVRWDVPLLDGYDHEFVPNVSPDPGTHHLRGLDNPDLVPRVLAFRPDAVLMFGWNFASHLRALRAFHGRVPVLFRGDSTLLDERPGARHLPRRLARRAWLRWVYRHTDVALYVGQHNRAYFRAHGVPEARLTHAPHAVDDTHFADPAHDAEAQAWRRSLGIPDEATVFTFAGKLEHKKAPDVVLDAFVQADLPGAHLVVVGSGPMERALRETAAGSAAGAVRVHFVGFQNQSRMPAAYRLGDVLVLASRSETWGLAVNEAFASGRPAIVSDRVGCAPDLVLEGETGAVVPAGDVATLARAMERTAPQAARMGREAQVFIEDWSMERLADAVEGAVWRVTSGRSTALTPRV